MTRPGHWVGPALRVLGLVAVGWALVVGRWWALLAALGACAATFGLRFGAAAGWTRPGAATSPLALDFARVLDLARRAHGGAAAWAVGLPDGPLEAAGGAALAATVRERGAALVQLASVDGRTHVVRDDAGAYVAVGDFPYGAGLLLPPGGAGPAGTEAAADELRRLIAGLRLGEERARETPATQITRRLALTAQRAETLDGIARAGAELAEHVSLRGAVVVVQDPGTGANVVRAVSDAADKRLLGRTLSAEAAASRAVERQVPVASRGTEDVFGPGAPERRRRDRAGTAYPLLDGRVVVGALVVIGPPTEPGGAAAEVLGRLVVELGPRLAAARAVHEAERQAVRDPLTGLCNRREFERVVQRFRAETAARRDAATLIYADLDHFKQLNDALGHDAGDAALRHVAGVLEGQIRDGDLVARIGGEEFALWLPRTALPAGLEVAERVRQAVEASGWRWHGSARRLTVSCGVASYPDPIADLDNLRSTADAALYRAKQAGRNRVEKAARGG